MSFPVVLVFSQMASRIVGKILKIWKECVGNLLALAFRDLQ